MPQIIPAAATFIARELEGLNGPFGLFVAEPFGALSLDFLLERRDRWPTG
jgi:hypothetical protein